MKWLSGRSILAMCMLFGVSAYAQSADDDPDSYSDATLEADLRAELDDIFEGTLPDTEAELISGFERVLHDEGDSSDPKEAAITWAELVEEMSEAETTVHDVVASAVHATKKPDPPDAPHEDSENAGRDSLPDLGPRPDALSLRDWINAALGKVEAGLVHEITKVKSNK